MFTGSRWVGLLVLGLSLQGCLSESSLEQRAPVGGGGGGTVTPSETLAPMKVKNSATAAGHTARVEQVTISAFDGTPLALTVYFPELDAAEPAPLLLHSHGFGGSRTRSLDFDEATQGSEIGIDTLQVAYNQKNPVAGRAGWYVISYDQRGHGDTGGRVTILDPEFEGKDFQTILDWAEANLPNLGYRNKAGQPNPVVGTIGRSYGGAFQLIGTGLDERIDAMVPNGTWYDLRYSLAPATVPKTTYLNALVAAGLNSNRGRFDPFLFQGLAEANTTGQVSDDIVTRLGSQGSISYCDLSANLPNGMTLKNDVPAFFIQGARDVLFNLNEGLQNFECYRQVNKNAKLLFVKFGHSLDALGIQESPADSLAGTPAKYAFNESLVWLKSTAQTCPASVFDAATGRCVMPLKNLMFQFLVQNLIGNSQAKSANYLGFDPLPLPEITAVLEDGRADPTAIEIKASGSSRPRLNTQAAPSDFTAPTMVNTGVTGIPSGLTYTDASQLARPIYVALNNANQPGCYVGTPKARVKVDPVGPASPEAPIVYVGLGITRADGSQSVLHEQITPVKGYGEHNLDLAGISAQLMEGDAITLTLQGYSPVFITSFNRLPAPVNVSASVALPARVADPTGMCRS
ncbi:alpha/beta hydrolase [Limnobacter sp.]|uniref:alpha/beta hydrolase n=1 Tax=Limnobacter sp. TaxID=2003368 RepID=UPI00351501D2